MKSRSGVVRLAGGPARIVYAGFTDKGESRKINEDNFLVSPDTAVFAVADGVGGLGAGDLASRLALDAVADLLLDYAQRRDEVSLDTLVEEANSEVLVRKKAIDRDMATTIVLVRVEHGRARIAHVGDSRAYIRRQGSREVEQLTRDHSLVRELYQTGRISREEMRTDPRRNVITRALGTGAEVEAERGEVLLAPGDLLLLCTDGLTTMLDDARISVIIDRHAAEPEACARELVHQANQAGGHDNITVMLLRYEMDS